jgi:hypothetical protein
MANPVLSTWSPISKFTLVHPMSYENKLHYIPSDAPRWALQNGVFDISTLDRSPYPTGSFNHKSRFWLDHFLRSFRSIVKRMNVNVSWDRVLDAVLDALSDDTNPARNCPLGAEIWLIYWKNEELEISRKSCESIILLSVFGKVAGTLTQIFLYEKMRLFTLYKMSQSLDWALSKKYRKRVKNHVTTDHKMDGLLWCNDSWA